jgi:hypothetical protein
VKVVHASGAVVDVDAIEVLDVRVGGGRYDDTYSNWAYNGVWYDYSASGPYNNTLHYSLTVGNYAEFTFEGTQFMLLYTGHTNRGVLDIYVDNVKVDSLNQYSSSPLAWQRSWTSGVYAAGFHTVKLVHASGAVVDVDAIEVIP